MQLKMDFVDNNNEQPLPSENHFPRIPWVQIRLILQLLNIKVYSTGPLVVKYRGRLRAYRLT